MKPHTQRTLFGWCVVLAVSCGALALYYYRYAGTVHTMGFSQAFTAFVVLSLLSLLVSLLPTHPVAAAPIDPYTALVTSAPITAPAATATSGSASPPMRRPTAEEWLERTLSRAEPEPTQSVEYWRGRYEAEREAFQRLSQAQAQTVTAAPAPRPRPAVSRRPKTRAADRPLNRIPPRLSDAVVASMRAPAVVSAPVDVAPDKVVPAAPVAAESPEPALVVEAPAEPAPVAAEKEPVIATPGPPIVTALEPPLVTAATNPEESPPDWPFEPFTDALLERPAPEDPDSGPPQGMERFLITTGANGNEK